MTAARLFGVRNAFTNKSPNNLTISLTLKILDACDLEIMRVYETPRSLIAIFDLSRTRVSVQQTYIAKSHCTLPFLAKHMKPVTCYILCDDVAALETQKNLGAGSAFLVTSLEQIPLKLADNQVVYESQNYQQILAEKSLKTAEGRALLLENPLTRALITSKQVNACLEYFMDSKEGRDFIAKADDLRNKIESIYLNTIAGIVTQDDGLHTLKMSAAYYLVTTEDGRELLRHDKNLLGKIAEEYHRYLQQCENALTPGC